MFRAPLDLRFGQSAERMIDNRRHEIVHAERVALHFGLVQKFRGHDDCGRPPKGFEADAVMRTARRTRASIANRGQDDVVVGGNGGDQGRVGVFREAFLAVVVDRREMEPFLQPRRLRYHRKAPKDRR